MNQTEDLTVYVTSVREIVAGILLVAVTLAIHGFAMPMTIRVHGALEPRSDRSRSFARGVAALIVSSWMIIAVHLVEVMVWAVFFLWKKQFPNLSTSYYFSLNEYTTLGSSFDLKSDWRLMEGMLATAGMLAFAWSTGVLMSIALRFQDRQLEGARDKARNKVHPAPEAPHHGER